MQILFWAILGLFCFLVGFHLITGKALFQDVLGFSTDLSEPKNVIFLVVWILIMIGVAGYVYGIWQWLFRKFKK